VKKSPGLMKLAVYLMKLTFYAFHVISICIVISAYFRPNSPENLSSLFEDPKNVGFGWKFLSLLYILHVECIFHLNGFLCMSVFIPVLVLFPGVIKQLMWVCKVHFCNSEKGANLFWTSFLTVCVIYCSIIQKALPINFFPDFTTFFKILL